MQASGNGHMLTHLYCKWIILWYLQEINSRESKRVTLLIAVNYVSTTREEVQPCTNANCFRKAEINYFRKLYCLCAKMRTEIVFCSRIYYTFLIHRVMIIQSLKLKFLFWCNQWHWGLRRCVQWAERCLLGRFHICRQQDSDFINFQCKWYNQKSCCRWQRMGWRKWISWQITSHMTGNSHWWESWQSLSMFLLPLWILSMFLLSVGVNSFLHCVECYSLNRFTYKVNNWLFWKK